MELSETSVIELIVGLKPCDKLKLETDRFVGASITHITEICDNIVPKPATF